MAARKSSTLTLRIDPAIKEALRIIADREHRSITNTIEVLIRNYCSSTGITIPKQDEMIKEESLPGHGNENA